MQGEVYTYSYYNMKQDKVAVYVDIQIPFLILTVVSCYIFSL